MGEFHMAKWLSSEWLEQYKELSENQPVRPGATATIQYEITDGPEGTVYYYWVVEDGKLLECQLGEMDEPELVLTEQYQDALAIQKGELDATAAFMQGKIKVAGNMGKLMSLLPVTTSEEYRNLQEEILAKTEF